MKHTVRYFHTLRSVTKRPYFWMFRLYGLGLQSRIFHRHVQGLSLRWHLKESYGNGGLRTANLPLSAF